MFPSVNLFYSVSIDVLRAIMSICSRAVSYQVTDDASSIVLFRSCDNVNGNEM
jgi:hypothetical protein